MNMNQYIGLCCAKWINPFCVCGGTVAQWSVVSGIIHKRSSAKTKKCGLFNSQIYLNIS